MNGIAMHVLLYSVSSEFLGLNLLLAKGRSFKSEKTVCNALQREVRPTRSFTHSGQVVVSYRIGSEVLLLHVDPFPHGSSGLIVLEDKGCGRKHGHQCLFDIHDPAEDVLAIFADAVQLRDRTILLFPRLIVADFFTADPRPEQGITYTVLRILVCFDVS